MKLLTRILSLLTIVSLSLFFANCGGGDGGGTSKEKTQLKKLSKTWSIATTNGADLNGDDRTADFANFKLTISGTYDSDSPEGPYQYSVSGSRPDPSPWPASGTWEFVNISSGNEGNLLRNNDDRTMHYKINSNGQLVLNINCEGCDFEGAKTSEVDGEWTFTFNP